MIEGKKVLIIISLGLLLTITFFNVVLGATFEGYTLDVDYAQEIGLDAQTGALAIIIVLIATAVAIGIQIMGCGLSEQSVKTILLLIGYGSIWGFFSALSANLILSIEPFGYIFYMILTIIYMIGVMQKISEG